MIHQMRLSVVVVALGTFPRITSKDHWGKSYFPKTQHSQKVSKGPSRTKNATALESVKHPITPRSFEPWSALMIRQEKRHININVLVRLALGRRRVYPNFLLILQRGDPVCPRSKNSLSRGTCRGRRTAEKSMC